MKSDVPLRFGRIFFFGHTLDLENFHEIFFPDNVVYVSWILTCGSKLELLCTLSGRLAVVRGRANNRRVLQPGG